MGGALAALGLLTQCGWDTDTEYFPRRLGIYLRVNHHLWWLPDSGSAIAISLPVRSIASSPWGLLALSENGQILYRFEAGGLFPAQTITLPEACYNVRTFYEKLAVCLGCASGLRVAHGTQKRFAVRWEHRSSSFPLTHLAVASAFAIGGGEKYVVVYEPQSFAQVAELLLPGSLQALWIEYPGGAAGTYLDSVGGLRGFSYGARERLFFTDQRVSARLRATSPYLTSSLGTEYRGAVTLSLDSVLTPGGWRRVKSFGVDFAQGEVFFLREDTVWRYSLKDPQRVQFVGVYPGGQEIEVVPIYRYGSIEVTMR